MLGDHLGWKWLIYNPLHFLHFHDYSVRDAPKVLEALESCFPSVVSMIDVGAGSGAYAAEARRRGHLAVGCEYSRFGRLLARRQGVEMLPFDLTNNPPLLVDRTFDLAYCFEVAEHIPATLGDRLVTVLSELSDRVVFTAAPPGQGGTGHINEQPPEYWRARFAARGLRLDPDKTAELRASLKDVESWWLPRNAMVFLRE